MKYSVFAILLSLSTSALAEQVAIENISFSPNPATVGQSQVFSFTYRNATKCYQALADNQELIYYQGPVSSGEHFWQSPQRDKAESYTFKVICEGPNGKAEQLVTNTVDLTPKRECHFMGNTSIELYGCRTVGGEDFVKVSQLATKRRSLNQGRKSKLKVVGEHVYYTYFNTIKRETAYFVADIWGKKAPVQVTPFISEYGNDTILEEFQIINDRAIWKIIKRGSPSTEQWFSACPFAASEPVTPVMDPIKGYLLDTFKIEGNEASWSVFDRAAFPYPEERLEKVILPYCLD